MMLRTAKVVAVHARRRTVDLVMNDNGARVADVQVISSHASSDSGGWDIPAVPLPGSEANPDTLAANGRNMVATVGMIGGRHVVTGFLPTQGTEMAFTEDNRAVHRHPSGAYVTTAPDGSMELFHPSGAFLRIGTGGHQDLAEVSADGNWSIPAGAAPPQITLETAGFTLTILPNGATSLVTTSQLRMTFADAVLTGDVHLVGNLTTTGDVVAGTVSLQGHTNGGQHVP